MLFAVQRCIAQRIVIIKHIKSVNVVGTISDDDNYDEEVLMTSESEEWNGLKS